MKLLFNSNGSSLIVSTSTSTPLATLILISPLRRVSLVWNPLFVQMLQELNAVLLIVAPPLAPLALIIVHMLVEARAHNFSFVFFLGADSSSFGGA
jgi:cytochrome c oxidase subunit IV